MASHFICSSSRIPSESTFVNSWSRSDCNRTEMCIFANEYTLLITRMNTLFRRIKLWLQSLSFRTGVIVLLCCIPFYILSFAQMLLPISAAAKGVLWTVLFGMAKTCQYGGLTILGVEGYQRLKDWLKRKKRQPRP